MVRVAQKLTGDTYGDGGATLPFSVDVLFSPVTEKTTAEPLVDEVLGT